MSGGLGAAGHALGMPEGGPWGGVSAGVVRDSEGQELSRPVCTQGFFDHRRCPAS